MTHRIYNFSPGPSVLPLRVLEEAQENLLALPSIGMSPLEISHRSEIFDGIMHEADSDIRELARISDDYHILFLQGGASLQFSMVPMNLLPKGGKADYIITDYFSKKAMSEARKFGVINVAGSTESDNFRHVPAQNELKLDPDSAYAHFTSNNTVFGTQWKREPEAGNVPLISDATSDILSRPLDVTKYGMIYASAQKNLGIAGVTLVIIRDDLLARIPKGLPATLDYNTHAQNKSMYHTPPVFPIYVMCLVLKWLGQQGGLKRVAQRNEEKAKLLYDEIDSSGYYSGYSERNSRSLMNVTFRLMTAELEVLFVNEAAKEGFIGLRGHRSVGGCRASIYNAFPRDGVEALVSFMAEFERKHG